MNRKKQTNNNNKCLNYTNSKRKVQDEAIKTQKRKSYDGESEK